MVTASQFGRFPDAAHKENFLESMRTRQRPSADIAEGHRSALLVHYANISYRLGGEQLTIGPQGEFVNNVPAAGMFQRENRRPWVIDPRG